MGTTGEIKDLYLSQLHSLRETDESTQQSLEQFTANSTVNSELEKYGTTIAVVTEPTGGITDVTDEYIESLGMPLEYLDELREERERLDIDDSVLCHNQAVENIQLDQKYREFIQTDKNAQDAIHALANRVKSGETITLVCFEKKPKYCHRRTLKEVIETEVQNFD